MASYQATRVQTREQFNDFCQSEALPALNPELIQRHEADAHWLVTGPGGAAEARGSLWWNKVPPYPGQRLGVIGHYAARSAAGGIHLLRQACRQLADQGCTMVVGPMDGNTWRSHRLVLEPGTEPVFFLEPQNPVAWSAHFTRSGFTILARYDSRVTPNLQLRLPVLDCLQCR